MQVRGVDWYWIFWTLTLFAGACGLLIVFFLPETYVPYILVCEAKRLRKETGDDRWHAALEKKNNDGISGTLKRTVLKPFIMLFEEPMLLVITLYMSLVCACTPRGPVEARDADALIPPQMASSTVRGSPPLPYRAQS